MKLKSEGQSMPGAELRETGIRRLRYHTPDTELDRAQLSGALDCSTNALIVVDGFGRICAANSAAARLLGVSRESLHGSYVQNHLAALDSEVSVLDQALQDPSEIHITLPDGRRATATLTPLSDAGGRYTHACVALALPRSGSDAGLEAVGRLVAEVAHDINNQLSAALNYVFILRRRLRGDPELAAHFEELQSTAWRAATLTSGLKLLGPKRSSDSELLDVAAVIELLAPLLRHITAGSQVEFRLVHDLPPVRLSRAHLEQLVAMLTLAAAARARRRGKVVIRTELKQAAGDHAPASVRVVWDLYRIQEGPRLIFAPNAARAHGALRRAMMRCRARPGHDARRVWIDLAVAADQSAK